MYTNHKTVITFVNVFENSYGVLKSIKLAESGAFISKDYQKNCKSQNINYNYGTENLVTGTGLVEKTIQSLKNITLANLKDGIILRGSVNRAF